MRRYTLAILLFAQACTNAGGCGGQSGGIGEPIPGHFDRTLLEQNVVQARFSPAGFKYIENNLMDLAAAAVGHPLTFVIPKTPIAGSFYACAGPGGCTASLDVVPGTLKIQRLAPDGSGKSKIHIIANVNVDVPDLFYEAADNDPSADCRIDLHYVNHFNDACSSPGVSYGAADANACNTFCQNNNQGSGRQIGADLSIGVDPILGFPTISVDDIAITLAGSNGCNAVADIRVLQPNRAVPSCGNNQSCITYNQTILSNAPFICVGAQIGDDLISGFESVIKQAAMQALRSQVAQVLTQACVTSANCEQGLSCDLVRVADGYPSGCSGTGCLLPPASLKVCNKGGTAVPPLVGIEAQEDLAVLDGGAITPSTVGPIKMMAGVGGAVGNDSDSDLQARGVTVGDDQRGLTIGGFMGLDTKQAGCVPPQPRPQTHGFPALSMPDEVEVFDTAKKSMQAHSYQAAVSLSSDALNQLTYAVYTNGAMCITFAGTSTFKLNSQMLSLLVQSLGRLENGETMPAFMNVFPTEVPEFSIGQGELTYDATGTPQVKTAHVQLDVKKLNIEFYAFFADRYVRLFTIIVDFNVGVFFDFNGQGQLLPVVSNLQNGIGQVVVTNIDILGEKSEKLQTVLPALLDFALPQVTAAVLKPFPLPFNTLLPGYSFEVIGMRGMSPIAGTARYDFLSMFGAISAKGGAPARDELAQATVSNGPPRVEAPASLLDAAFAPVVSVPLADGTLEYSYRLDGGIYSPFAVANELRIQRPVLRIAGEHEVDILARRVGQPRSLSAPHTVKFTVAQGAAADTALSMNPQPIHAQGCASSGAGAGWLASLLLLALRRRRMKSSAH